MKKMSSDELHETVRRALAEVDRRLASGELDGSGRFCTDEELVARLATGSLRRKPQTKPAERKTEEPAA